MPHINRIRLVNVNFNDAKGIYDDFMMNLNGKSTTYDLMNTGGKSLLLLMILQTVLPNTYLKKEKPLKNIFIGGNTKRTSHCLVEWILDEGYQYKYMLTGFCARKKQDTDLDEANSSDKLEINYFNYCYFYNDINKYDIKYIPLVSKENGEKEYMSYDKLRTLISNMKKEDLPIQVFDSKKDYMKNIEYYGLIPAEWKLISEINVSENYIEKYFKENKTSRKLIENFLIKIIDNVNYADEENKLADTLIELKDNLTEFRKKSDNKQEFLQAKEMYGKLKEKNDYLIEELKKIDNVNRKAYEAYIFNKENKGLLKDKIEKEKNEIEALEQENTKMENANKKLEIDKYYEEKDKIEKEIENLNDKKNKIEINFNNERRKLKLSKAQNEYVDYTENKAKAQQIQIKIDSLSIGEKGLKEKYEKYGYNYKLGLYRQIEETSKIYKEQEILKKEKNEARKIAKDQENSARDMLGKQSAKMEQLEESEKEVNESIKSITQEFTQSGKMDLLLNLEHGISDKKQELKELQNKIENSTNKIEKLKNDEINQEIEKNKLESKLEILKGKSDFNKQEIEKYEQRKDSVEKLAITFKVGEIDNLKEKLQDEIKIEENQKTDYQIEIKNKEKKLDLIKKYNMLVPNEDIFRLKEKLQEKCNYITTGIERLRELEPNQRDEFLQKNPIFLYSIFIDDDTFKKIQNKIIDIETENLVPIISIEVLRQQKIIEEKDVIFPVHKSIYKNLNNTELENYKGALNQSIKSLNDKIDLCSKKEEKIRNYLSEIERLQIDYPKEKVEQIYNEKQEFASKIESLNNKIKEANRIRQNKKEEQEAIGKKLTKMQSDLELLKTDIEGLEELKVLQANLEKIQKRKVSELKEYNAQKEILEEKEEVCKQIEDELEIAKNILIEMERSKEELENKYKDLPEFVTTEVINEEFEAIKNTFEALDDKMKNSNKQYTELQSIYKMHTEMMEKCLQTIKDNECDLEYFENKGQLSKVPSTVIQEYANNVKQISEEFTKITEAVKEKEDTKTSLNAKIEILKEQLLNSTGETYNEELRIKEILEIKKQMEQNSVAIKFNKKQIKEITKRIRSVEEQKNSLEKEYELLKTYIQEKEVEKFEVNIEKLLESEIYTYKKIRDDGKSIDKFVQKIQGEFSKYIEYIKTQVETFYIKQDVIETIAQMKIPTKLDEAKTIEKGITENLNILDEKIRHIEEALKILEGYQQNFITKCFEKAETIVRDLNKLPGLSRIKIGGKDVNIIKLNLYEYEKEEKQIKIKQYIYDLVKEMENEPEKMTKEYLNECLSSKALVAQVTNMDKAVVKLYKVEDIQENSTYKKWEDDLGSDGQVNAIYFMFAVCIISYISMLTRKESLSSARKVIIADNPFGATSAVFLWKVMFSILKENNVQLIAPGHNISKEIVSMFEVNYILKHEYYNGNKKSVMVDKELRTEDDLDSMNFEVIDGDQQSIFALN